MLPLLLLLAGTAAGLPPVDDRGASAVRGAVRGAGDVDGDGAPDLLLADRCGAVWVLSGADGAPVRRLAAERARGYGASLATVGDVSGDGRPELLVGAESRAYLHSGADGSLLRVLRSPRGDGSFGSAVAGGRDADGDGVPDYAVGEPAAKALRPWAELEEGRSAVVEVASTGRSLRLCHGDEEVARLPLTLDPERRTTAER